MAVIRVISRFQWITCMVFYVLFTNGYIQMSVAQEEPVVATPGLPTVTVRGFLNFKTTVDGTVIVFTPASEVPPPSKEPKPEKPSPDSFTSSSTVPSNAFFEKAVLNSQEGMHGGFQDINYGAPPPQNSLEAIKTRVPGLNIFDNKIKDPFLQHISDNAVLPSVGQVNNDLDKIKKLQSSQNQYPTGLVTVLGGTFVVGDSTTVYETKVIGTYIDGKYAQILQSTSHIVMPPPSTAIITPSLTYSTVKRTQNSENGEFSNSILKDIPSFSSEKAFVSSQVTKSKSVILSEEAIEISSTSSSILSTPTISFNEFSASSLSHLLEKVPSQGINIIPSLIVRKEETEEPRVYSKQSEIKSSTVLESSFTSTDGFITLDKDLPTETLENAMKSSSIRKFKPSIPVSSTFVRLPDADNTAVLSKSHRNNTSRTRFLSPRRPSQTVRLNRFKVKLTLRQDSPEEYNVTLPADDEDMEEDHTNKGEEDVEVVTEGAGIIVDPARVVFQETTITSEVTLHVGRRKSVRTLTITTSVPLTVNPTDIQDILSSQSTAMDGADQHIVTRTFTTTERALKTSVVPIFDGKSTMYHTVTESFFIMKIITAYRTLPPGDTSAIESFLDEPEISATTLEVAANIPPSVIQTAPTEQMPAEDTIQSSITMQISGITQPQATNPLLSLGHALSNNPLAAVYLGLQQLNAQMTLYSTVTDVSTYVTTETIYSTKTIRYYDGRSTRHRTISDPISTKKNTVTTTITSVQPYLNTHALQQQQQLQKLIAATQLSPPQVQYNTVTSTYTTVTTATSLSKRIYTLIYNGFSTKFRTVTSTSLYPTTVTVTSTAKIPIAPTAVNIPFAYPFTALTN